MRMATAFKFSKNIDDVFLHALDGGVLVQHALDLDLRDGRPRQ